MQQEVDSMFDNGTLTLVNLPTCRRVINNMWVYKVKTDHLDQVKRFKAQYVAKGCSQHKLSTTPRLSHPSSARQASAMLAISPAMDLELCLTDIDTAFMYAPIKEDIFIRQPLGFSYGTAKVCHLKLCLYGLNQ
jgi:hypothetical protein